MRTLILPQKQRFSPAFQAPAIFEFLDEIGDEFGRIWGHPPKCARSKIESVSNDRCQAFWIPNGAPVGTNLRTCDPENERWEIAWTTKGMAGFAHIQAKSDEHGNIVMNYVSPLPKPLRRTTFIPTDSEGWRWKLEFSADGGENGVEVYRIKATRSQ